MVDEEKTSALVQLTPQGFYRPRMVYFPASNIDGVSSFFYGCFNLPDPLDHTFVPDSATPTHFLELARRNILASSAAGLMCLILLL